MFWRIEAPGIKVDIVDPKDFGSGDKFIEFKGQDDAARFLEMFSIHWSNFDRMLEAIRSAGEPPTARSHQETAKQLARLVVTDRFRIRRSESSEERRFRGPFGMKLGVWIPRTQTKISSSSAPTKNEDAPAEKAKKLFLSIPIDPNSPDHDHFQFTLESTDEGKSYRKTKKVSDDKIPGNESIELEFTNLVPGLSYTMIVDLGNDIRYPLFENLSYSSLFG